MDGGSVQNAVISNNIANVNTPRYKKKSVTFQEELEKSITQTNDQVLELKRTNAKHLSGRQDTIIKTIDIKEMTDTKLRNDGNNVDIDMELAALAENNLYFNSLAELLSTQLSLLKTSVTEGRR